MSTINWSLIATIDKYVVGFVNACSITKKIFVIQNVSKMEVDSKKATDTVLIGKFVKG